MKYKLTILNACAALFLIGCIIYTLLKYPVLSKEEGWGVVAMIGIFLFASTALIVDLLIQKFVKDPGYRIFIEILVVMIYALLLYFG